jgi:hypothetical protein
MLDRVGSSFLVAAAQKVQSDCGLQGKFRFVRSHMFLGFR